MVEHHPTDGQEEKETRFLALDKCLPRRKFLQVLEIGPTVNERPVTLCYDKQWLSILKATNHLLATDAVAHHMPGPGYLGGRWNFEPTEDELTEICQQFGDEFKIPLNFEITVPPFNPQRESLKNLRNTALPNAELNKQTELFCEKLQIDDPLDIILGRKKKRSSNDDINIMNISSLTGGSVKDGELDTDVTLNQIPSVDVSLNKDEIKLDDDDDDDVDSLPIGESEPGEPRLCDSSGPNDSLPKKSKLQLPEPKAETPVMQLSSPRKEEEIDVSIMDTQNIESSAFTIDTQGGSSMSLEDSFEPKKRLKRRNVAIYDDDEND